MSIQTIGRTGFVVLTIAAALISASAQAGEVVEKGANGKVSRRYSVDKNKQIYGPYEEFYESGKLKLRGTYFNGKKGGQWVVYDDNSKRVLESFSYKNDLLDGVYTRYGASGQPALKLTYKAGAMQYPMFAYDEKGNARRIAYPHNYDEVVKFTQTMYYDEFPNTHWTTKPVAEAPYKEGVLAPDTIEVAMNVTKLIRYIAGVPWQDLKIDPTLSTKAGMAALLMSKSERVQGKPPEKATGMDPKFYSSALAACGESIFHHRGNIPGAAARAFVDETDNDDATKFENRQWLLSPALGKFGIGVAGAEVAFDVSDGNHQAKADWNLIAYPSEGYFPSALFNGKASWTVFVNLAHFKIPTKENDLRVTLQKLDDKYQPDGAVMETQLTKPASVSKSINWSVIAFKPFDENLPLQPARYWVEVFGLQNSAGQDVPFGYIVEVINVVVPSRYVDKPKEQPKELTMDEKVEEQKKLAQSWVGKVVFDVQTYGRRCTLYRQDDDSSKWWKIEVPGEKTIEVVAHADPEGKIVLITINGKDVMGK